MKTEEMRINFLIANSSKSHAIEIELNGINNLRYRNVEIELTDEQLKKLNLKTESPHFEKVIDCQILLEEE
jgi:hypothetical protein